MKERVKKVVFTVGVNYISQPIEIEHIIDIEAKEVFFEACLICPKPVKSPYRSTKHSRAKRHCGQSQKNIRIDHK